MNTDRRVNTKESGGISPGIIDPFIYLLVDLSVDRVLLSGSLLLPRAQAATCISGAWRTRGRLLRSCFSSRSASTIHCLFTTYKPGAHPSHVSLEWSGVRSGDDPWPGRDQMPRRLQGLPPSGPSATPGGHRTNWVWQVTDVLTAPIRRLPSPFVLKSLAHLYSFPVVLTEFHDGEKMNQTTDV